MLQQVITNRFESLKQEIVIIDKTLKKVNGDYGNYTEIDQEIFITWGMSAMTLLSQVFENESIQYKQFKVYFDQFNGFEADAYIKCKSVFNSAYNDYINGYIFSLRGLVTSDLMEDGLAQAEELLSANYKDPACVVAGVCLETSLKELCDKNGIQHAKLDKMNADLKKANVYNTGTQKQITAWADLRNNAAHGNWGEYTKTDVKHMIEGVRSFLITHF